STGFARAQPAPAAPRDAPFPMPAPAPQIGSVESRDGMMLDGLWKWVIDPFDTARRKPRDRRTVWRDLQEDVIAGPLIEYEWASSPDMLLPGDWNSRERELAFYEGTAYFHRRFDFATRPDERVFLQFEAVNYRSTVWLNGRELGHHEGGFTPFSFEVTGIVQAGDNHITVRADNRHSNETLPASDFDWQNYGGITRSIRLLRTPATFIRDWFIRLEGGQIVADVWLDGPARSRQPVSISFENSGLTMFGVTESTGHARMTSSRPRDLELWQPQRPILQPLSIQSPVETQTDRIALRTIATRGKEILLNGQPVLIKGIALHEEALGATASRTVSLAQGRALLEEAKALGCNFVRLAHYPHAAHMARLADEMGLMVWAEVPIYWEDVNYASARTLTLAKAMVEELIVRDRNRGSVIIWSVANETPQTEVRTRFLTAVIDHVRSLDGTRLVSAALDKNVDIGGVADGETRINVRDELGAKLDVIAMNQYEGWYGNRRPDTLDQVTFSTTYDKPMVCSEFGADALYGHRGPKEERWTEDFQAWLYEATLKRLAETPGMVGVIPWILKDFRSPRRWHGRFQSNWNRKGVIDETGNRKLAFAVLRDFYAGWNLPGGR
ncbi:MAG: beta galactosidase jelly roll domain-containing protein, partial [Hyphomonadaceae bacterium]|nr:beta galactosidase jelly roll domain-containing protein [Hyphomonadaceae bacterium]